MPLKVLPSPPIGGTAPNINSVYSGRFLCLADRLSPRVTAQGRGPQNMFGGGRATQKQVPASFTYLAASLGAFVFLPVCLTGADAPELNRARVAG
jgi:hypothetical protein